MSIAQINKPFERTDFQYDIDYDYERSSCICDAYKNDDYCRCTTIERAWVETINTSRLIAKLYHKYCKEHSEINEYCFERICVVFKIYDKDCYEIETCGGYYGEEVDGVYFENEEKVFNTYQELLKLNSDVEKIKYILELEYGYLIDRVVNTTSVKIIVVNPEDVKLPQREYFIKLNKNVIESYKHRHERLPVAVCVRKEDRIILIDGYHRFVANKDATTNTIIVLE